MLDKKEITKELKWLGEVIDIAEFFDYAVVSYKEKAMHTNETTDTTMYSIFVNDKKCGESFYDYDSAIAACIAYKLEGCNHKADRYFIKSLK